MRPICVLDLGKAPKSVNHRSEGKGANIGAKAKAKEVVALAWARLAMDGGVTVARQKEGERWAVRPVYINGRPPKDSDNCHRTLKPYIDSCVQVVRRKDKLPNTFHDVPGEAPLLIDDDDAHLVRLPPLRIKEKGAKPCLILEFWIESDWDALPAAERESTFRVETSTRSEETPSEKPEDSQCEPCFVDGVEKKAARQVGEIMMCEECAAMQDDPTTPPRMPKCRQTDDQGKLFELPLGSPLDLVCLDVDRLISEFGVRRCLVVARHEGPEGMDQIAVLPLDEDEDWITNVAHVRESNDYLPEDGLLFVDMNEDIREKFRAVWQRWCDAGHKVAQSAESVKTWRGDLVEAMGSLRRAEDQTTTAKAGLKAATKWQEAKQAEVNKLADLAEGTEPWSWPEKA